MPEALRLLGILSLFGALIAAGVLLGLFAFDSAQAHVDTPARTATAIPTRTPMPTSTPTLTPTPSFTPRIPAFGVGYGLAYIWESRPALRSPRPEGAGSEAEGPVLSRSPDPEHGEGEGAADGHLNTFDNVFSCTTCGDGKPDNREYFVCATGYEATLSGRELGALERPPGWDIPGVCIVGVWGATFDRMAIGISEDAAMALSVTPGTAPEIEIYADNIPEGYLLVGPAGGEEDHNEDSRSARPGLSPRMTR